MRRVGQFLNHFDDLPVIGPVFGALMFSRVFWDIIFLGDLTAIAVYIFTHLKWEFSVPGYDFMAKYDLPAGL